MRISVIGTGYVGLVSGVCLAELGHQVACVDIDKEKVAQINHGNTPIYEKGLDELLKKNVGNNLTATSNLFEAVQESELSIVAVGTPFDGKEIDLSYIKDAAYQIGTVFSEKEDYHVVVIKSTVVPGTTNGLVLPILEKASGKKAGIHFGVGMNPEFLREGEAVDDFMFPDRIVIGADDIKTRDRLRKLFLPFKNVELVETNTKTAEMIKYTANSLLATMISFSNEIANLCSAIGDIDVADVMRGVHLDKRLSPITQDGSRIMPSFTTYIEAGCGFGGSCFPKDVNALISYGKRSNVSMRLLEAVVHINERQPFEIVSIVKKHFKSLNKIPLAVLGLAFKPGTDDMRESPSIPIVTALLAEGASLKAYDPVAVHHAKEIFNHHKIQYCQTLKEAVEDVEAIIILTRWHEFNELPSLIIGRKQQPIIIDGRRMLKKNSVKFYDGIGM